MPVKIFRDGFALHQDHRFAVFQNGIVYLLPLFDAYICGKLRNKFLGVEDIISQHGEEGHDQGCLCGFLGLKRVFH